MSPRILIVGGVAAGASAATKARRTNEAAEIVVFERGEYVSFANCGLPYYISREIADRGNLLVVTPELFRTRHDVDVRLRHEALSIDRAEKTVTVRDLSSDRTTVETYDALVLAPGAQPIVPPIPMVDAPNVFSMRTIPDTDRVEAHVRRRKPQHATVIGAGYVGLEMAEALGERGMDVRIVEKLDQILPPLDRDMAAVMAGYVQSEGVELILGDGVASMSGTGEVSEITLESGQTLPTDLVLVSIGVRPDVSLARAADLELGATGAIRVDAGMRTSDPHIWAAGDAVESLHMVTGGPFWSPLAGPANKQGRVAGCNAAGGTMRYGGSLGTSIVRFGEMVAAATGLKEGTARDAGYDVDTVLLHAKQHAGYYPGAQNLTVKLVYEQRDGRLLGGQAVGRDGVDKRIDVLATALAGRMTVDDLSDLDLAYAPPFGSARDPVIVAGFIAQNQINGLVRHITADELRAELANGSPVQLIDVRTRAEYDVSRIPGAKLVPVDDLRGRLDEIDRDRPAVVYCHVGMRGYLACRTLVAHGYDVRNLAGGIRSWRFETTQTPAYAT